MEQEANVETAYMYQMWLEYVKFKSKSQCEIYFKTQFLSFKNFFLVINVDSLVTCHNEV